MNRISRVSLLLIALVLSSIGISRNTHELLTTLQIGITSAEDSLSTQLAEKGLADSYGLQQQSELVDGSSQSFPVPVSKISSAGATAATLLLEQRLWGLAQAYLARCSTICPSLSGHTLIFPFHYFW